MTKRRREQLINKANKAFGRPFSIRNAETGKRGYYILTPSDETMFIDFGNTKIEWEAVDINQPGYQSKGIVTL